MKTTKQLASLPIMHGTRFVMVVIFGLRMVANIPKNYYENLLRYVSHTQVFFLTIIEFFTKLVMQSVYQNQLIPYILAYTHI